MEEFFQVIAVVLIWIIILAVLVYSLVIVVKALFGIDLTKLVISDIVKYVAIAITCFVAGFALGYKVAQRSKRRPVHTVRL